MPGKGIYLAGGLMRSLQEFIDEDIFMKNFLLNRKSMHANVLKQMPLASINQEMTCLHGSLNFINKIKRLVYSSSASVYGDACQVPMTEEHPFNNKNFYGATKIAGEAMCRAYHDRYGLSYVGLRYMNVYGPHQDQTAAYTGVIPIMLNKIDANEAPTINGDGSQAYDFIDVEDVARCNICSLESEVVDEFYNVGTGVQTTIKELCNTILELRNSVLEVNYNPYSKDDARRLVQNRIGCPKKASTELGFNYKYDLRTGLQRLIDWRKTHYSENY